MSAITILGSDWWQLPHQTQVMLIYAILGYSNIISAQFLSEQQYGNNRLIIP